MADSEIASQAPEMTTGKAVLIYAASLIGLSVLVLLVANVNAIPGLVAFVAYLALGFMLNRVVLRGLIEWHPMHNTLQNVASAKLGMMLFWPFRYPVLFFQLLVTKHL